METQPPLTQTPTQEEGSPNMTFIGVAIGAMMALTIVGMMYYKNKLEKQYSSASPVKKITTQPSYATPVPFQPKGTPTAVPISSKADLEAQQKVLDSLDMTSITKDLDITSTESSQFAL